MAITNKKNLPSKRQFYNKLNEFVEEAYEQLLLPLPKMGQNAYGQLRRRGVLLNTNSGRFRNAHTPPGRIHVKGTQSKSGRAGKITFIVRDNEVFDPNFNEFYWPKLANDMKTYFGTQNKYRNYWLPAYKYLLGNLQNYSILYATYKPFWTNRKDDETQEKVNEKSQERQDMFDLILGEAIDEGIL